MAGFYIVKHHPSCIYQWRVHHVTTRLWLTRTTQLSLHRTEEDAETTAQLYREYTRLWMAEREPVVPSRNETAP